MSSKTPVERKTKRKSSNDDNLTATKAEDKLKKTLYSVSTPRNFIQKSSAADIYASKSSTQSVKAPKKTSAPASKTTNVSPMKDLLKSSSSSVSQISTKSNRIKSLNSVNDSKTPRYTDSVPKSSRSTSVGVAKKLPFTNVTVNSPVIKKKIIRVNTENEKETGKRKPHEEDKSNIKINTKVKNRSNDIQKTQKDVNRDDITANQKKRSENISIKGIERKELINQKTVPERKRTKTRTLDEEEIKILTPDVVDNNFEMLNLKNKLTAQPKAFYVELNEPIPKLEPSTSKTTKESDNEISYEDDFDSYESDFDSYQSDRASTTEHDCDCPTNDQDCPSNDQGCPSDDQGCPSYVHNDCDNNVQENDDAHSKEERMLDSGNFELRDPRPNGKSKPMDYIVEISEDTDKKVSLTDEGFQEMSSSSGLSSIKTLHVDVLDRPLFVDFSKSKENRRKRKVFERLKRRAEDILCMVTLHEMSYDLYEMKPISYDLYMATFGRFNYTQTAAQTFDDGITEEIQTDEILKSDKWTQNPVEFSNNTKYLYEENKNLKKDNSVEDFAFLYNDKNKTDNLVDDNYRINPLRIYLEQRDGVGRNEMLPYETYKSKLQKDDYDAKKLGKFLKKFENKLSNVLSANSGRTMSNLNKSTKFPFSNEYSLITTRDMTDETCKSFLNNSQIVSCMFSDTKTNLIVTVHGKSSNRLKKCVLCLWDLSVTILEPLKFFIATDDVVIGRFRGSTSGFLVGALCDGTIQLWDLSEDATWYVFEEKGSTKMMEIEIYSEGGSDRGKYFKNKQHTRLQVCAYTSSAMNVCNSESADRIVGLELMGENTKLDDRKILAQLSVLLSTGILTMWSIIQEKTKNLRNDIGKALWSKMRLQRDQTINLLNHIDLSVNYEHDKESMDVNFNLNLAKKRMSKKRYERNRTKVSHPKSAISKSADVNNANRKNIVDNKVTWDNNTVVCNHLKIINLNGVEMFLVAKNGGEVLSCCRNVGAFRVKTLCVASSASSVTCIEASPHGFPYFLAATDCGTVSMCSLLDYRVLLTLDCRNGPSSSTEKCQSDHKGRYLGSVTVQNTDKSNVLESKLPISTVSWLHSNPFCIAATFATSVVVWELTFSDIRAKCRSDAIACSAGEKSLALLTKEGDVQVFKLTEPQQNYLELFQKYVALM